MAMEITDSNYKEVIGKNNAVVIDFWAEWCGPCRMIGPIIDELASEYENNVKITKCDVDSNPELANEYGIRSIPTVLFFKDGKVIDKLIGAAPKKTFQTKIDALI